MARDLVQQTAEPEALAKQTAQPGELKVPSPINESRRVG
jgi:hypothetical protein